MSIYTYLKIVAVVFALNNVSAANTPKILNVEENPTKYEPEWDSLDKRPLPEWYDEAKIGIFLHWGVYGVPSIGTEWFWYYWKEDQDQTLIDFMKKNYPPNFTYQDFAKDFKAEFFEPDQWAELFRKAGAKYVVLTSKHHEGFTMWPSAYSYSWNVKDVGPNRDLLGDLAKAVRAKDLKFGVYHSLLEWFNPMYLADKDHLFLQQTFSVNKVLPEMYELVNKYNPSIIWSDGDWEAPDLYWKSKDFLAWLYNESPVKDEVVVNDRWGLGIPCHHGDFYNCKDRYNPGTLQPHKWENAMTIDKQSWGYRRNASSTEYLTTHELIQTLVETVSCGGNVLINVGPTKEGTIAPLFQERLLQLGEWLAINGEAIYSSKPWTFQNDTLTSGVWYTTRNNAVYAINLNWPKNNIVSLAALNGTIISRITMLGNEDQPLKWINDANSVNVKFPDKATVKSKWAWTLKIQ